jgi:hypothetical protein
MWGGVLTKAKSMAEEERSHQVSTTRLTHEEGLRKADHP